MAHYLYVLQSVTLNHLEPRMKTPLDCYSQVSSRVTMSDQLLVQLDFISKRTVKTMRMAVKWLIKCLCFYRLFRLSLQEQRDILHSLRQAAFETETENSLSHERRRSLCAKEFKKLGFSVSD